MHDPVALVSIPTTPVTPVRFVAASGVKHPLALCGLGITALFALGFFAAGLPVISVCMLVVSGVWSFVLGSALGTANERCETPRHHKVAPEEIASIEVRAIYRAILFGLAEIESALAAAPRLGTSMASVIQRCRQAVELTGRIALLANPIQRYLDTHDASLIRSALERLRARTETANDDGAVGAWSHAVAARVRQLATLDQLAAKREQICARLELVHAAFESFAAAIVRIHVLDEEQIVLAGESVTDQLEEIGDDLHVLESALDLELAS
jgi:hypothetical protein